MYAFPGLGEDGDFVCDEGRLHGATPRSCVREVSCAAKAAFRVRRQGGTRRVAPEISRRSRRSLEADRGIDGANRRQAIRLAAGFVVARSATPFAKRFEEPKTAGTRNSHEGA